MQQRIEYIDIAKGIGILLVYIGHCSKGTPNISSLIEWIYAFHMPLFFFISGLLFPNKKISAITFYRNKFASLVIPYILFTIIHYSLLKVFHMPAGAIGILLRGWGTNALWFIPVLLLANTAHYHIINGDWWQKILVLLTLISCMIWKAHTNSWAPYCISELPWFYFCFLSGFFMKETVRQTTTISHPWIYGLVGFVIMTIIVFAVAYPYNNNYRHQDDDFICWLLKYVAGMLGTVSTLLIAASIARTNQLKKALSWFGQNSLVILCTHQLFYNILQTINYQPFIRGGYNHLIIWTLVISVIWSYNRYVEPFIKRIHT